ncbi:hypothetical protein DVH05_002822 [Phytophthora capsici]|nr:hypothetical protein DVH05_002822 [Phytophthora capsici]
MANGENAERPCEAQGPHNSTRATENAGQQQTATMDTQADAGTSFTDSSTTATSSAAVRDISRRPRVMDSDLRTWDLYDLSGAVAPDSLENMKNIFRRFRGLRQKGIEGVEYGALQESWCAFIKRWNRTKQSGEDFLAWLERRECIVTEHSLSELRSRVCGLTYHDLERMCYVSVAEGCDTCIGPRPTEEDWNQHVAERPLGSAEDDWIQRYKRALSEASRSTSAAGTSRRRSQRSRSPLTAARAGEDRGDRAGRRLRSHPRSRHRSRSQLRSRRRSRSRSRGRSSRRSPSPARVPRSRSRSWSRSTWADLRTPQGSTRTREPRLGRREEDWRGAPMYHLQGGTQASEPYIGEQPGSSGWRGGDSAREEDPRAPRYDRQSSGHLQRSRQSEGDRRVDSSRVLVGQNDDAVENHYWDAMREVDMAVQRSSDAAQTATALRQSNRELLERVRMLERAVHGQAQTGAQPRAPGTSGALARRARREGRSTYASAPAHPSEPSQES